MSINCKVAAHTFEPGIYSNEELAWLLDHLEKPPVVAFHKPLPEGVNRRAVQLLVEELFSLQQLREHNGVEWGFPLSDHTEERGYAAVKDSILRYLAWMERVELIRDRTDRAVGNASMFSWDSMGNAFKYGIDSDSGQLARTEICDDGTRRPFGVKLLDKGRRALKGLGDVAPWVSK